jgi:hypothetical protein
MKFFKFASHQAAAGSTRELSNAGVLDFHARDAGNVARLKPTICYGFDLSEPYWARTPAPPGETACIGRPIWIRTPVGMPCVPELLFAESVAATTLLNRVLARGKMELTPVD